MKIEANDKEVQDIFSLGYFKIPRFQRPYSWTIDEVENFWNDVVLDDTDNYFIGSMVVYQSQKPYFGIVDGQQRLTTITLMLAAIRNAFVAIGQVNLAKGVHKYIEKANIDNENEFVLKTQSSFPYLQDYIQSYHSHGLDCDIGFEEKKLEEAFKLICSKLSIQVPALKDEEAQQDSLFTDHDTSAVLELKKLRDKVLSLKLVFIQLGNEDDAYLIFETLNARGKDLTTSDLVKNLILKKCKNDSRSIDQSKEHWNSILRRFDDFHSSSVIDSFLLHYWLSEHNYTTEMKLFSHVKTYVDVVPNNASKLLKTLSRVAPHYRKLQVPESGIWDKNEEGVKRHLVALNVFKVKQQTSMTLALVRAYSEQRMSLKNLKQFLQKIEAFHYCFNAITSQRSSGVVATKYSKMAISLTNAQSHDEIQAILSELSTFFKSKMPDREEFVIKFAELRYSSTNTKLKKLVKYTLSLLTSDASNGLPIDYENATIEHLIPEAYNASEDEALVISSIGNLILLDKHTNSIELGSRPPRQKIDYLNSQSYPLDEVLVQTHDMDADSVTKRVGQMAVRIYDKLYNCI